MDRPFYFIVPLWGERFRNYFIDLCLPSLLAPGNLPALVTRRPSKFLIWTRPDDWEAMNASPIFRLLEQHIEVAFFEIPPCPSGEQSCLHMGFAHRRGLQLAYEAKAYPFVFQPDSMFADGTLRRLQELSAKGVQLTLVPALRFAEEPLFDNLQKFGVDARNRNGAATPIALSGRQLAEAALSSMHRETITYEWSAPYFLSTPSAAWWRVPGEDGIVLHSLSWAALLLDFQAVSSHDLSTFDNWTIDGDYIYRNLSGITRIHLAVDSDDIFIASWAPAAEKACYYSLTPERRLQRKLTGNLARKIRFRRWFYSPAVDPLKRSIFFATIRWHSAPLNDNWRGVEERALNTLLSCVAPSPEAAKLAQLSFNGRTALLGKAGQALTAISCRLVLGTPAQLLSGRYSLPFRVVRKVCVVSYRARDICRLLWANRSIIIQRSGQILRGDHTARLRAARRVHEAVNQLIGREIST